MARRKKDQPQGPSSNTLVRMFRLEPDEKEALGKTLGRIKTVQEFLADAAEGIKDTGFPKAIAASIPWIGPLGEAAAEAVAPIKFLVKLFEKLTKIDDPK